jgi:hypothetical protein
MQDGEKLSMEQIRVFLHIVLDAETRPERIMGDFKNIRQPGIGPVEN